MNLQAKHFDAFFKELWHKENCTPFPWQSRLAEQVCGGKWPEIIDLPTASGKTACLDIAVFALAMQADRKPSERTVGRRIFFVVNRRIIVDEAYERAVEIARKLREAAPRSVLGAVAEALRNLSGDADAPPLDVAVLRGGIYRDNRWARSIAQPTIITSTIDQVGSRLLFRGYGVSEAARPLHAALVAHDSLLLLDEAHISQPFAQTLDAVRRYRGEKWADQPIHMPFHVVQMTATPGGDAKDVFHLNRDDRKHPILKGRLKAAKPVSLICADKAKNDKALGELAKVMADQAKKLLADGRETVAVIVNRVATARKVYELLRASQKDQAEIHLAIGRMRPLDRDDLTAAIQARVGKSHKECEDGKPLFVVATQCLEVGADFDFDAMVSECASLDALRQRFGRFNRKGRAIEAQGCVVIAKEQVKSAKDLKALEKAGELADPIYGNALARMWNRLQSIAKNETVDFGVTAMEKAMREVKNLAPLLAPRVDAPVMFPAYVDVWAQTNPTPAPDPDVALFLHGPQRGEPEVQVCWRADLPGAADRDTWAQVVSLCPPSSPECMPVPIGVVRAWLGRKDEEDKRGDMLDAATPEASEETASDRSMPCVALAWRGPSESRLVNSPDDIRPGDTLVLPVKAGGWSVFGHIPYVPDDPTDPLADRIDIAERAFHQSHGRAILRLTPSRLAAWSHVDAVSVLQAWLDDPEKDLSDAEICRALQQIAGALPAESPDADTLRLLADKKQGLTWERYLGREKGVVLMTRRRVVADKSFLLAMDDGQDDTSRIARADRTEMVSLKKHTAHVDQALCDMLSLLPIAPLEEALCAAACCHDLGKADERFQALLLNSDLSDAWAQKALWAKSTQMPMTLAQRSAAYRRSTLPLGFRHEMLSVQLAEAAAGLLPKDGILHDLALHLIASHHGRARPFAPVVQDADLPSVDVNVDDIRFSLTHEQRKDIAPPHRLDSGIAERFWTLTRRFGWWGLAYLEAILRLADQRASQREDEDENTTPSQSSAAREAIA